MTTAIQRARKNIPDSLRRLPRRTRTLLAQLNADTSIPIAQLAYAAFRAAGWTQEAAYSQIVADVRGDSAKRGGHRWDRATSHVIRLIPADAAQELVSDWGTLALSAHEDPSVRLKAIDISNRVLRRYADEGVSVTVMGDVKLEEPSEPPQGADGMVLD